jgi:hypothetical protein
MKQRKDQVPGWFPALLFFMRGIGHFIANGKICRFEKPLNYPYIFKEYCKTADSEW